MRVVSDECMVYEFSQLLYEGETLEGYVWATGSLKLSDIAVLGMISPAIGALAVSHYMVAFTNERLIFAALNNTTAETMGYFEVRLDKIQSYSIKNKLFKMGLTLLLEGDNSLELNISSSAIGSKLSHQKEMRELLVDKLSQLY